MGFLDGIKAALGGQAGAQDDARSCERCKNSTHCKRRATGNGDACENYDEMP